MECESEIKEIIKKNKIDFNYISILNLNHENKFCILYNMEDFTILQTLKSSDIIFLPINIPGIDKNISEVCAIKILKIICKYIHIKIILTVNTSIPVMNILKKDDIYHIKTDKNSKISSTLELFNLLRKYCLKCQNI